MRFSKLKYLSAVSFIIGLITVNVFTQTSESRDAFMLYRFDTNGSSVQSMSEYGFEVAQTMSARPDLKLVVRLCSTEKMTVAVGTAAVDPISLTWFLMNAKETLPKISVDSILVEVSPNCVKSGAVSTAVELWLIAKSKTSDYEQIKACKLRETQYRSKDDEREDVFVGTKKYREAFNRLYKDISLRTQDAGLIIGYHNIGRTRLVEKQLLNLKNNVNKKKLNSENLFFGMLEWNQDDSVGQIKNVVVKAIRVTDDCAPKGELGSIVFID
jgi:hypothetical protein